MSILLSLATGLAWAVLALPLLWLLYAVGNAWIIERRIRGPRKVHGR